MKNRILVVDDKQNTLKVLAAILQDEGYDVRMAKDGLEALKIFEEEDNFDVVLADLKMPRMNGVELFRKINSIEENIPYIIMTAHGSIESAVEAMKEGITNYLLKPLNYEELGIVIKRAINERKMSRELQNLRKEARERGFFQKMIGSHPKMEEIFKLVRTVAPTDVPVILNGETGTGKELLAKAIHSLSQRQNEPMICINSAALSETLLEDELFGHVKGAFTGAYVNKKGRLESANGGTLFLDEIARMSLNLQTKLLRFLQDGTFEPVGSSETRKVDVRVITATNQNLREEIKKGRFLNDLLYRLDVITINIPPLKDRGDDIILLTNFFIKRFSKEYKKTVDSINQDAMEMILNHTWPGNVRELENCIARGVILSRDKAIVVEGLPERIRRADNIGSIDDKKELINNIPEKGVTIKELEEELIRKTLKNCRGNKSMTSEYLGISRKSLYEKISRYNIEQ